MRAWAPRTREATRFEPDAFAAEYSRYYETGKSSVNTPGENARHVANSIVYLELDHYVGETANPIAASPMTTRNMVSIIKLSCFIEASVPPRLCVVKLGNFCDQCRLEVPVEYMAVQRHHDMIEEFLWRFHIPNAQVAAATRGAIVGHVNSEDGTLPRKHILLHCSLQ